MHKGKGVIMTQPISAEERIRRSLAALNAPEPINLTLEQWKQVIEEAEEEDDEEGGRPADCPR